jgi:hypothetical protein
LLTLKDFNLANIECEIENMERDIPFLHCSLRMSRNYQSYVFRYLVPIFVITLNACFVFRFDGNPLADRLNFLITNLLTVVAFFSVLAGLLPQISYLTLIDMYMITSLVFVGSMALVCVFLDYVALTDPNEPTQEAIFIMTLTLCLVSNIGFGYYCSYIRGVEIKKLSMTRHEVDMAEYVRLNGDVDAKDEFLVHSYIHKEKACSLPDGTCKQVYEGD